MRFYIYVDTARQWRWYLLSPNNRKIADSAEGYYNKNDCLAGINLVKGAWNALVYEI